MTYFKTRIFTSKGNMTWWFRIKSYDPKACSSMEFFKNHLNVPQFFFHEIHFSIHRSIREIWNNSKRLLHKWTFPQKRNSWTWRTDLCLFFFFFFFPWLGIGGWRLVSQSQELFFDVTRHVCVHGPQNTVGDESLLDQVWATGIARQDPPFLSCQALTGLGILTFVAAPGAHAGLEILGVGAGDAEIQLCLQHALPHPLPFVAGGRAAGGPRGPVGVDAGFGGVIWEEYVTCFLWGP